MPSILALEKLGQSVWLDTIDRDLLVSGGLTRLIEEHGVRGVTTNPSIFEQAFAHGTAYDAPIEALALAGKDSRAIYETLAVEDVTRAADLLRPVHEMSEGADGFVSIEVSPMLAYDTAGTVAEARRLWAWVDRPNVMVKVPGTPEGLPAIEQLIADGVNVNVTLLFSVDVYRRVIEAYLAGLERRVRARESLETVHSVASFFVSRVDTEVDKRLAARGASGAVEATRLGGLSGRAAVASAKLAYQEYLAAFYAPRFRELLAKGAHVQRPLWASTSTKNPEYRDTMYVDGLVGPDTVNTMPLATLRAFEEHGTAVRAIDQDVEGARQLVEMIEQCGVSMRQVTDQLAIEGVRKFADAHQALLAALEVKRDQLVSRSPLRASRRLEAFSARVAALLAREGGGTLRRLLARDPALWSDDPKARQEIGERLGWLDLPSTMEPQLRALTSFAEEVRGAKYARVLLLGMGGSSLAPEVFSRAFGARRGFPTLTVLDTTDPGAIAAAERAAPLGKTFFLVSSKSGTTLETSDLFAYFWKRTGGRAEQFAAITDPGTPLASLAKEQRLRRLFENPPDIGGRYSALSYFGLVPAALLGVDLAALLERAARMAEACAAPAPENNPGAQLGAALASGWTAGRDKVTLVMAKGLEAFGAWAEQLLAESTGKRGKGLVPVASEPLGAPAVYGKDRLFVSMELGGSPDPALQQQLDALETAGHPVVRLSLRDLSDLGAEFYRWEVATALAGAWLGINPFDQPNVAESKANTDRVLQQLVASVAPSAPAPADPLRLRDALSIWLAGIAPGDYVALLAYIGPGAAHDAELTAMREAIRDALGTATTAGYGPRYLHSTGQLHKGGPPTGAFLAFEDDGGPELQVPDEDYGFGMLKLAQELGDLIALERRGRRLLRVRLGPEGLGEVRAALAAALQARR